MSRSRKKNPGFVDRNPFMKNYANRRVRRISPETFEEVLSSGNSYRKYCCSYDICDFKCIIYDKRELDEWYWIPNHHAFMK